MKSFFSSLSIKVGAIVIIAEVIVLAMTGVLYTQRFADEVDRRVENQLLLPGKMMDAGLLELDTVADAEQMQVLIGEELIESVIVGANQVVFFSSEPAYLNQQVDNTPLDQSLFDASLDEGRVISLDEGKEIVTVTPIFASDRQTVRFFVYIKAANTEAQAEKANQVNLFLIGSVITIVLTSFIIYLAFKFTVFDRLEKILRTLRQIERGNLSARVDHRGSYDEMGALATSVNAMAGKREQAENDLRKLNEELEQRVAIRTRDLNVASQVSRQATTELDRSSLLRKVAELTREGFGLYHVSIFLYDRAKESLVLEEGTGEIASQMKAEGKAFQISDRGLVPQAARTREVALANNVNVDGNHLTNHHLPRTNSELALPMLFGDNLVGVLDLQAEQAQRFSPDDIRVMTTLAEQIAIAVRNAQLYEDSQDARKEAEKANSVKSQFLASMSHELRTPLNAILNFTQFVSSGMLGAVNDEQVDMLVKATDSGRHLLSLINDVLDISKIEANSLKLFIEHDVDLREEIDSLASTAEAVLVDKHVALELDIQDIPLITGDKRRLRQIMLNLISNACKFTDEGYVRISLRPEPEHILFVVEDTGPGIAPEEHQLVFESFRQTKSGLKKGEGTGLGLPISRKLTEAHGGEMWLESQVDKGATFFVRLPIHPVHLAEAKEITI
ncbi:MAG: ATP-binding protein [Chloroflexi bacterium]|nr:ATP-binding protein [Chloroflexota bacterium]